MLFPVLLPHESSPFIKKGRAFQLVERTKPIVPGDVVAFSEDGLIIQDFARHVGIAITKAEFCMLEPRETTITASMDYPGYVFVRAAGTRHWYSSQDSRIFSFVQKEDPEERIHLRKPFQIKLGDAITFCPFGDADDEEDIEIDVPSTSTIEGIAVHRDDFISYWHDKNGMTPGEEVNYPSDVFIRSVEGIVFVCPCKDCWIVEEHAITKEKLRDLGIKITKRKLLSLQQAIDEAVRFRVRGAGFGELGNAFREAYALKLKAVGGVEARRTRSGDRYIRMGH